MCICDREGWLFRELLLSYYVAENIETPDFSHVGIFLYQYFAAAKIINIAEQCSPMATF